MIPLRHHCVALFSGIRIIRILAETDDNVIKGILTGPFRRNSPISKNAKT
jgi:hypothetical protein